MNVSVAAGRCILIGMAVNFFAAGQERQPAKPNPSKMDVLRELSSSFEEISQHTGRAVVQIFVRSYTTTESSQNGDVLTAENSSVYLRLPKSSQEPSWTPWLIWSIPSRTSCCN